MTAVEITANGCLTVRHEGMAFPLCGGQVRDDLPSALVERLIASGVAVEVVADETEDADETEKEESKKKDEPEADEDPVQEPVFDVDLDPVDYDDEDDEE